LAKEVQIDRALDIDRIDRSFKFSLSDPCSRRKVSSQGSCLLRYKNKLFP